MREKRKKPSELQKAFLLAENQGIAVNPDGTEIEPNERSIDHITAIANGGRNTMDNLQFMDRKMNASKGAGIDKKWGACLFFDAEINLSALRQSQRSLYERVCMPDFAQLLIEDREAANMLLYLVCYVIGAGKTLSLYVLAFAINHAINRRRNHYPRVKRVLVICKESAIRDQVKSDLENDPLRYGISSDVPRVGVPTNSSQLNDKRWVEMYDIVVVCLQSLWGTADNHIKTEITIDKISHFDLIAVDEPHFANGQIQRLTEITPRSLVFGFTSSPVNADGDPLRNMVLFDVYGYDAAVRNDQSLKYVADVNRGEQLVHVVTPESATVQRGGVRFEATELSQIMGYSQNMRPIFTLFEETANRLKHVDEEMKRSTLIAPHREILRPGIKSVEIGMRYYQHAMIVVGSIREGKFLQDVANRFFKAYRNQFPEEYGFTASFVDGEMGLSGDHPWFWSYKNGYRISKDACRILIVCNIGREGINNPPLGLVTVATQSHSLIEHLQRSIGRAIRGVQRLEGDKLIVPPRCLDEVTILTHQIYGNTPAIERSAKFILDMPGHLENLVTIDQFLNNSNSLNALENPDPLDTETSVTTQEKLQIFEAYVEGKKGGVPEDEIRDHVAQIFSSGGDKKVKNAESYFQECTENISRAQGSIFATNLPLIDVVLDEVNPENASPEKIITYMQNYEPDLFEKFSEHMDVLLAFGRSMYAKHEERYRLPELTREDILSNIKDGIGRQFKREFIFNNSYLPEVGGVALHIALKKTINKACKLIFGADSVDVVGNNTVFDTPYHHHILNRENIRREILRWINKQLTDQGFFPNRSIDGMNIQ